MQRPGLAIDVLPVGVHPERHHAGAELLEHLGRHLVGGAVSAVDGDHEPVQGQLTRERALREDVVATDRVVDPEGLADLLARRPQGIDGTRHHEALDLRLVLVGQLEPRAAEELDAVVLERVVGRRDHHARVCPQRAREERDARGGQRPDEQHVDPHRADARRHRGLQHVPREPRVLADEDLVATRRSLAHVRQRPAQSQRRLRRHGLDVRCAAHAVGPEEPPRLAHHPPPCSFGVGTVTRTNSGLRPVTTSGAGRRTCTGTSCTPGASPPASTKTAPSGSFQSCRTGSGPRIPTPTSAGATLAPAPFRRAIGTCLNSCDTIRSAKRTATRTRSGTRVTKSPPGSRRTVRSSGVDRPSMSMRRVLISFKASTVLAGPVTSTWSGNAVDSAVYPSVGSPARLAFTGKRRFESRSSFASSRIGAMRTAFSRRGSSGFIVAWFGSMLTFPSVAFDRSTTSRVFSPSTLSRIVRGPRSVTVTPLAGDSSVTINPAGTLRIATGRSTTRSASRSSSLIEYQRKHARNADTSLRPQLWRTMAPSRRRYGTAARHDVRSDRPSPSPGGDVAGGGAVRRRRTLGSLIPPPGAAAWCAASPRRCRA